MLSIIKQYKKSFLSLLRSDFAEQINKSDLDKFNEFDNEKKDKILSQNKDILKTYLEDLDKSKDSKIVSKAGDTRDDFGFSQYPSLKEAMKNERAFRSILRSLGMDDKVLSTDGILVSKISEKIDSYIGETNKIKEQANNEKRSLVDDVNKNQVENQEDFSYLLSSVNTKPSSGELSLTHEDGKYKLEIDDFVTFGSDPVYTFNKKPTSKDIERVVNNFNHSKNLQGWENLPEEMQDNIGTKLQEQDTKEVNRTESRKSSVLGIDTGSHEKNEYLQNSSLKKLLARSDLADIYDKMSVKLKDFIEKDESGKQVLKLNSYFGRNYTSVFEDDVTDILVNAGYKPTGLGVITPDELISVYGTISDHLATQNKIKGKELRDEDKINMLFDFNKDGKLGVEMESKVGEAQMSSTMFDNLTSNGYDILFKNLGFKGGFAEVNTLMGKNFYSTRENVQDAINSAIDRGILPGELLVYGGPQKARQRLEKEMSDMKGEISKKVYSRLSERGIVPNDSQKTLFDKFVDGITPDSVGLINADGKWGGGFGYNLDFFNEMTDGFIDATVGIGMSENGPGVGVNLKLLGNWLDEYGTSINVSLANFILPLLTISQKIYESKGEGFRVDINGFIGPGVLGGGVGFEKLTEQNSAGIEHLGNEYEADLKDYLTTGKLNLIDGENADQKQAHFDQVKNIFEIETAGLTDEVAKKQYMELLISSFVKNYKDKLYQNSQGLSITGGGIGFISVAGLGNLVYPTIKGEFKSTEFTPSGHNLKEERENTKQKLTLEQIKSIGGEIDDIYKGYKVLSFSAGQIHKVSDSTGKAQVEEKDGKLYISGVSTSDISIDTHTQYDRLVRTLVIGDGEVDDKGYYVETDRKDITSDITGLSQTKEGGSHYEKTLPENADLNSSLENISQSINKNTRTKKGALDFLDPKKSTEQRWQGLGEIANTKSMKKSGLAEFMSNNQNNKEYIISTLAQVGRRSETAYEGNMEKYNEDKSLDKLIAKDKTRRKGFDSILTSSLSDEANNYYAKLKEKKGNLGKTTINGLSFDAVSTTGVGGKKGSVRGIDVLYSNLSIITANGEPILVPVDKNKYDQFVQNIQSLSMIGDSKQRLIDGLNDGSVTLMYYKDPEGFDDRIIPIFKDKDTITPMTFGNRSNSNTVYDQGNDKMGFGIAVARKLPKEENVKNTVVENPPVEPVKKPVVEVPVKQPETKPEKPVEVNPPVNEIKNPPKTETITPIPNEVKSNIPVESSNKVTEVVTPITNETVKPKPGEVVVNNPEKTPIVPPPVIIPGSNTTKIDTATGSNVNKVDDTSLTNNGGTGNVIQVKPTGVVNSGNSVGNVENGL